METTTIRTLANSYTYQDVETYTARFKYAPKWEDDVPINIGDQVIMTAEGEYYPKGTQGTVVGFYNGGTFYVGVDFGYALSGGVNLYGLITEPHGQFLYPRKLHCISAPIDDEENKIMQSILDEAKTGPKVALIDGKIFTLTLSPRQNSDELIGTLMRSVAKRVSTFRQEANVKVIALERKAKEMFALPEIGFNDVKRGMQVYKELNTIHYVVPLHYAPKFIGTVSGQERAITRQISDEHIKLLEQDVLMNIIVRQTGEVYGVGTMKKDYTIFNHYHGHGGDCMGTIFTPEIKSPLDIWNLRDTYQKTLDIVNAMGALQSAPEGMPRIAELNNKAKVKVTEGWSVGNTPGEIVVGSSVYVLEAQDGFQAVVGLVGKVTGIGGGLISVEFLISDDMMHSCHRTCENMHGWDFQRSKLILMPEGTRRTRVAQPVPTITTTAETPLPPSSETPSPEWMTRTFNARMERYAKYGTHESVIHVSTFCNRCGETYGVHYGDLGVICPDEFRVGRTFDVVVSVPLRWTRNALLPIDLRENSDEMKSYKFGLVLAGYNPICRVCGNSWLVHNDTCCPQEIIPAVS